MEALNFTPDLSKKDKLFFFVGYEGLSLNQGQTYTWTLPTAMERNGYSPTNYFTKPIYDPTTGSSAGSGTKPSPFPTVTLANGTYGCSGAGSAQAPSCTAYFIAPSRWDPVAAKMMADNTIWPAPNTANPNAPTNNSVALSTIHSRSLISRSTTRCTKKIASSAVHRISATI
jgi:hypothetical protein